MMRMQNTKFDAFAVVLLLVMLFIEAHADQLLKMGFSESGDLETLNPSKFAFRKFDPKIMLFISYTSKRK